MFTLTRSVSLSARLLQLNSPQQPSILSIFRPYTSPSESLTEGEQLIFDKLTKSLKPSRLHVTDVSGGCGSAYAVEIVSDAFKGQPIVKQHRMVNEILKDELKVMHALRLTTAVD